MTKIKVYCVFLEGIHNDIHVISREYATNDSSTAKIQLENEVSVGGCIPLILCTDEELEQKRQEWLNS